MNITYAYIRGFSDCKFRFRFRERGGALKVRLAVGRRSRGRVATRTVTLMDGIRPDARERDIRAIVDACRKLYGCPVIGWRVVRRYEPAAGEAVPERGEPEAREAASAAPPAAALAIIILMIRRWVSYYRKSAQLPPKTDMPRKRAGPACS